MIFAATSVRKQLLSSAASACVSGGTRRVLTVPATDAFAMIANAQRNVAPLDWRACTEPLNQLYWQIFDPGGAAQHLTVVTDLHEAACGDRRPVQSERDLEVAIVSAGCGKREMIENALAETLNVGELTGGGQIDARPPNGGIGVGILPLS